MSQSPNDKNQPAQRRSYEELLELSVCPKCGKPLHPGPCDSSENHPPQTTSSNSGGLEENDGRTQQEPGETYSRTASNLKNQNAENVHRVVRSPRPDTNPLLSRSFPHINDEEWRVFSQPPQNDTSRDNVPARQLVDTATETQPPPEPEPSVTFPFQQPLPPVTPGVIQKELKVSFGNLNSARVHSLQPISTNVFNTMAPFRTIKVRKVHEVPSESHNPVPQSVESENANELPGPSSSDSDQEPHRQPREYGLKKSEGVVGLKYVPRGSNMYVTAYYGRRSLSDDESQDKVVSEIVRKALDIKNLVSKKPLGLPQVHSERIIRLADEIISHHNQTSGAQKTSKRSDKIIARFAQSVIGISNQSETILDKLQTTNQRPTNISVSEAEAHLTKMVKRLRCRHRKLKRLAEAIMATRWRLLKTPKDKAPPTAGSKLPDAPKQGKTAEKLQTLYTNPAAKFKQLGACTGNETWREDDPVWKAMNDAATQAAEKHRRHHQVISSSEEELDTRQGKGRVNVKRKPEATSISQQLKGKSALSILRANWSSMTYVPARLDGGASRAKALEWIRSDEEVTAMNNLVDNWKRRCYSIGIISVVCTALLQSIYLCGPRMGDNYISFTMIESISGLPWLAPTGIYGIIILGYLFGGMAVVKTAAASEHSDTVNMYCKLRKKKFWFWYGLAGYYILVLVIRTAFWYDMIDDVEREMRDIFRDKLHYSEFPSRMVYTQFLFGCCGADGPGDYREAVTYGFPDSCYPRDGQVTYEEYYTTPPLPAPFGCATQVYNYSTRAMAVVFAISLIIWILAVLEVFHTLVPDQF